MNDKPDLPDHWAMIALLTGLAIAGLFFNTVVETVPNELFPLHLLAGIPVVMIFLGVPALAEKVYWRITD